MLKDCVQNPQAGKRVGDNILDIFWMTTTNRSDILLDSYTLARPWVMPDMFYVEADLSVDHYHWAAFSQPSPQRVDTMVLEYDVCVNPQVNPTVNPGANPNIALFWHYTCNPQYHSRLAAIEAATVAKDLCFRQEGQMNPQGCSDTDVPVINHAIWQGGAQHPLSVISSRYWLKDVASTSSAHLCIDGVGFITGKFGGPA